MTQQSYTCPMHPEIQRNEPGLCPKCGMALQPLIPQESHQEDPELIDMTRRFWRSAFLTLPIVILDMLHHFSIDLLSLRQFSWAEALLATPVVLWGGWPFFQRGIASVINRSLNMFSLIALGVFVAYTYSLLIMFASENALHKGICFESAAVITTLVLLGQVLELRARALAQQQMTALLTIYPQNARRILEDGEEEDVPLSHVQVGDLLRVVPGSKVPVDGIIIEGKSSVDQSIITGESMPVEKSLGDKVTGGTLNGLGSFVMRAEHVGDETMLSQIVHLVAAAQLTRAPIQRLADVISAYFVPIVILVSAISAIIWLIWGPEPKVSNAIVNAVAVLIIACPCALGLATPMSILVATTRSSRQGILVRKASALEKMERIDTLVVDKTGTLTEGHPKVNSFIVKDEKKKEYYLQLIASIERQSEHPLAMAIVQKALEDDLPFFEVTDFQSTTGKGVQGIVDGHAVLVGTRRFLEENNISDESFSEQIDKLRSDGETVLRFAVDGYFIAVLGIVDPIRSSSPEAIRILQKEGVRVVMLTGDNLQTAEAIARKADITQVMSDVLPNEKYTYVQKLQTEGHIVAMVGDGVNDAPALAQADVGIAMGSGTDVAMETADITLMVSDLSKVVQLRQISRSTMQNIRQNLFFAFIYNILGVPIAAGVLYPHFGILLSPVIASAMMAFSSVSVILNALRLSWKHEFSGR